MCCEDGRNGDCGLCVHVLCLERIEAQADRVPRPGCSPKGAHEMRQGGPGEGYICDGCCGRKIARLTVPACRHQGGRERPVCCRDCVRQASGGTVIERGVRRARWQAEHGSSEGKPRQTHHKQGLRHRLDDDADALCHFCQWLHESAGCRRPSCAEGLLNAVGRQRDGLRRGWVC